MSTCISTRTSIQMCVQHFGLGILGVKKPCACRVPEAQVLDASNAARFDPIDCIVYHSPTSEDLSGLCHAPEVQEPPLVRFSSFQKMLKVNTPVHAFINS